MIAPASACSRSRLENGCRDFTPLCEHRNALFSFRFDRFGPRLRRFRRFLMRLSLALCKVLVQLEASFRVMLRLLPQAVRIFWFALGEHLESCLPFKKFFNFARRRSRIERQRILPMNRSFRVVAIQQPLAAFNRYFLV